MGTEYVVASATDHVALRDGFIETYKDAFGGAPYYEVYENDEVTRDVWNPHLTEGVIILAVNDGLVIGLACAMPFAKSPLEVQQFLSEKQGSFPAPFGTTWYMSELAVRSSWRLKLVGSALMGACFERILQLGGVGYVARTALEGSNSIGLYERVGAKEVGVQDVSASAQVIDNGSKSTRRVYLGGLCREALDVARTWKGFRGLSG